MTFRGGGQGQRALQLSPTQIAESRRRREYLEVLSTECVDYLIGIVRDNLAETKHRVTAAKCILEEHRWATDRIEKSGQGQLDELTEQQARALLACDPQIRRLALEQATIDAPEARLLEQDETGEHRGGDPRG
jgi:hypothetical protein